MRNVVFIVRPIIRSPCIHGPPSVFLDANILKASVDTRLVLVPEPQKIEWGEREFEVDVHRPVFVNQNTKYLAQGNRERFEDTVALRSIAALAKEGRITLLMHQEVLFELMGLPRATGEGPKFYGAPIENVEGPFQYSRIAFDGTGRDYQYELLSRVEHPRFKELQRACGAYQGPNKPLHRNQVLDAFHILCAESASATYFLTLDDSLIRILIRRPRKTTVTPITPKRLLISLVSRHPMWLWPIWRERRRLFKSGRKLDSAAQDASREFWG